jgi:hypothetical protein
MSLQGLRLQLFLEVPKCNYVRKSLIIDVVCLPKPQMSRLEQSPAYGFDTTNFCQFSTHVLEDHCACSAVPAPLLNDFDNYTEALEHLIREEWMRGH